MVPFKVPGKVELALVRGQVRHFLYGGAGQWVMGSLEPSCVGLSDLLSVFMYVCNSCFCPHIVRMQTLIGAFSI